MRSPDTGELQRYDFQSTPYEVREYVETRDNEMDVWVNLARSHGATEVKQIRMVVVPFRCAYNIIISLFLSCIMHQCILDEDKKYILCKKILSVPLQTKIASVRKSCNLEDEKYYRRCPGTGRCFKREYYCSGERLYLGASMTITRGYTIKRIPIFPKKRPKSDYFLKQ